MKKIVFLVALVCFLLINFSTFLIAEEGDEIEKYLKSSEVESGYKDSRVYEALIETYDAVKDGLLDSIPFAKNLALRIVDYYQDNNVIVVLDIHHRKNIDKQNNILEEMISAKREILAGQQKILKAEADSKAEILSAIASLRADHDKLLNEISGLKSVRTGLKAKISGSKGKFSEQEVNKERQRGQPRTGRSIRGRLISSTE